MKKIGLLAAALILTANIFAQEETIEPKGKSHWSIALKAGVDYYRIEPTGSHFENASGTAGLLVDYTANPYWGMGLELTQNYFNREQVDGHTTDAVIFNNIDLTNLIAPNRKNNWSRFHFYTGVGLGASYFDNTMADGVVRTTAKGSGWGVVAAFNMMAEVRLSNNWGFFGEGQWRYYENGEILGGHDNGQLGADSWVLNVGFRFKFNANKKDHMRNALPEPVGGKDYDDEINNLKNQLKAAKADAAAANDAAAKAKKAQEDAEKASKAKDEDLQKQIDELKARPVIANNTVAKAAENGTAVVLNGVNFNLNSAELTNESKQILDGVAATLKSTSNWNSIEVAGYTDNTGTDEFNQEISSARAKAVADYLIGKGVEASKVNANGYGKENPIADNTTRAGREKNRRVEINFGK